LYSEITANKRKTVLLIAVLFLLIGTLAYFGGLYFGDFTITIGAIIGSIIYVLFSYFGSASAALLSTEQKKYKSQTILGFGEL
jgi:hypothetical protein